MKVIGESKKYNVFLCVLLNIGIMVLFALVCMLMDLETMFDFWISVIGAVLFSGWGWFSIVSMVIINKNAIKKDSIIIDGEKIILFDATGKTIEEEVKNIKKVIKNKEIDNPLYIMYPHDTTHKFNKKLLEKSKIGDLIFVFDDKRVSVSRVTNIDEIERIINEKRGM